MSPIGCQQLKRWQQSLQRTEGAAAVAVSTVDLEATSSFSGALGTSHASLHIEPKWLQEYAGFIRAVT